MTRVDDVSSSPMALVDQDRVEDIVADRLRLARQRAGLTQTQAANKLGIAPNTISGWESGTRMPRAPELARLAALYGCTTDYMVGVSEFPTSLPVGEILIDHEMVQRLLRCTSELEVARLVDWEPQMVTFWQVVRRGTRAGSMREVQGRMDRLADHLRNVAPNLWREFEQARREFANAKERSWIRILSQSSNDS